MEKNKCKRLPQWHCENYKPMSIEERAQVYAEIAKIRGDMPLELAEDVYKEIATEQRKIDIYKAWSILKGLIDESANDGYCEKHIITQEQFREAMEE